MAKFRTEETEYGIIKTFNGKLLSYSKDPLEYTNGEGEVKQYRAATFAFTDEHDKEQVVSGTIPEKSFQHGMEVGEKHMMTATINGKEVFFNMSHLGPVGERGDISMFDLENIEQQVNKTNKSIEEKIS